MAQLTLKTLCKRLAGSDWSETEHIVASIDHLAVVVHRLVYSPLWGFRCLTSCPLIRPWQDELAKAVAGFTMPDPIAELLASGEVTQGPRSVRAADFQRFLKIEFGGAALPKNTTLLPVGAPVALVWHEVLAAALGLNRSNLLRPESVGNPHDIGRLLATQELSFPGLLTLPVVHRQGGEIVAHRLPLFKPGSPLGPDRRYRASRWLWLPPDATSTRVCLVYQPARGGGEQVLDEVELTPKTNPFHLSVLFGRDHLAPEVRVNGGDWTRPIRAMVPPRRSDRLAGVTEPGKRASLAFLLDGSMSAADYERARNFVLGAVENLAGSTPPLRLGCVVYAEYLYKVGRTDPAPWDYETKFLQFTDPAGFQAFLEDTEPAGVVNDDTCDALELGLRHTQRLAWDGDVRLLMLVGNSPPHPSHQESQRWKILDRETGQHENLQWEAELWEACRAAEPGLLRGSVWVGLRPADRGLNAYAGVVWRKIGPDFRQPDIGIAAQRTLADYVRGLRKAHFVVDQPIALPLDEPLTTVLTPRGTLAAKR